jgi:lipid-A-disaccharide synthase
MLVAGEASGDHHAAALIREIRRQSPKAQCFGLGGLEMQAAGMDLKLNLASHGVIGFVEVLKHFAFFRQAFNLALSLLGNERPDLLILVDYPGFNLRLAKKAHSAGIKVCYYISPQVWAWKAGRVPMMARILNKILVTFPFEKPIYDAAGLDCAFVGNPLVELVKPSVQREAFRKKAGWGKEKIIGLLPGSREQEVRWLLPVMLKSAEKISRVFPESRFVIIKAPQLGVQIYQEGMIGAGPNTLLYEGKDSGQAYAARAACDFAMVASGTATLETALLHVPFVILYRVHPISYFIGKFLVKIHSIGLANVVAGRRIVPEFLQGDLDPGRIAETCLDFLNNPSLTKAQLDDLTPSLKGLGKPGVAKRAAREALALI